ncbi:precorrin-6y C5,15-methyltransferase (decarboxylating) subunit CbiE [Trichlorobacter lovleyi]|uniref:precorrin-6y C5,15-methyltransferase (decarboxylating) subunit CbiE n=1 Tax=Trichlorobacter lovleyi TaxID=313985 RepID=UPI0023F352A4|nr:precorrin-6y C5,15-methyltransferase (decarboxylating) subunit CbiE [Trichlorobacter lovleyi]
MHQPVISLIGMGIGGLDGLSAKARAAVAEASLLIGHPRHLALFPDHGGETVPLGSLPDLVHLLETTTKKAAVLASGDPLYFGIGRFLLQRLPKERISVFSNVSSVQYAFSLIKEPWDDALVLSVHGRELSAVLEQVLAAPKVCLLTDRTNTPQGIARALVQRTSGRYDAWLCEDLGMETQRCTRTDLHGLATCSCSDLNLLILLRRSS